MKKILTLVISMIVTCGQLSAKDYTLVSPNGKNEVTISNGITLKVSRQGREVVSVKANLNDRDFKVKNVKISKVLKHHVKAPFYRQSEFDDIFRQAIVYIDRDLTMEVRAYDEGVAYKFVNSVKGETIIKDETADFVFPEDAKAWLSYSTNKDNPYAMAFQNTYDETMLSKAKDTPVFLPATVQSGGVKVTILESDLHSYPGMFLKVNGIQLKATFAKYPKKMAYYRWRGMSYVAETENYIAKTAGTDCFPWRVMAITEKDTEMPTNNLVYALARANQIGDTSWIKPGKVAWDWWNDWNLKGVDFEAGINTRTYEYYIDFAAKNHIAYVVLDEGWYDSAKGDIMHAVKDIDLKHLINYAQQKGVGIVLWTVFNVLDEHLKEACESYAKMGIKGFKVDFLDRNDQTAVEMGERIAKTCAHYHLFLDYHGYFTPTGMNRTYPNILNYEGVFGMEECRWAKKETDIPRYDVTFPYIRGMAGNVDFTPGAMRNGTKNNWVECYQNPVSMGTRCHQLACYVLHDSPFTMLCDAPTNYEREQECTDLITSIPDTFDETRVLQGQIGSYIVTARRKDNDWYVGGQANWDGKGIELSLDFLNPSETYEATIVSDGVNANHNAEDYDIQVKYVKASDKLNIRMASGGGFLIIFKCLQSGAIQPVPSGKSIPDFYKKYLEAYGLYITSSEKVRNEALLQARDIMTLMLAKRPDIKQYMAKRGCHVMVIGEQEKTCDLPEYSHLCDTPEHIAYWNKRARGFGGAPEDDLSSSCGEENLLALPGDRYEGENILIHEFAHLIHTIGLLGVEPDFNQKLDEVMNHAKKNHLWENTYALTDRYEYFAECVQSFFNCNRYSNPANGVHNDINRRDKLKSYDPMMYQLLLNYFNETDIPIKNKIHE
jgi:alpha-glucosidase